MAAGTRELLARLDRIEQVVALGVDHESVGPAVAVAVGDAVVEAVRVAHELTIELADDDLWADLPLLCAVWTRVERLCDTVEQAGFRIGSAGTLVARTLTGLADLARRHDHLMAGLAELGDWPRDAASVARVDAAISDLTGAADRAFMAAVADDSASGVEAASAVLMAAAAEGGRAARVRDMLLREE